MPIIINDFEVVTEPEPGAPPPQTDAPTPPRTLRPEDVIRIQRRHRQRMERIRAT